MFFSLESHELKHTFSFIFRSTLIKINERAILIKAFITAKNTRTVLRDRSTEFMPKI